MGDVVVTTGHRAKEGHIVKACEAAKELSCPFVPRGGESLRGIREKYGAAFILVVKERLVVDTADGEFYFHPGMAHLRIKNLRLGKGDHLAEAMALAPGMRVLDCTLGMGADAIVESYVAGERGEVVALEKNPIVSFVVSRGLKSEAGERPEVREAMGRIRTECVDYMEYLRRQPDNSFDAVYFDPMFRHPFEKSSGINPLRALADHGPVTEDAIREALRVARFRVVMKESSQSGEFQRLGFTRWAGGKYSHVRYGVMTP